jgi:hypothetical protein
MVRTSIPVSTFKIKSLFALGIFKNGSWANIHLSKIFELNSAFYSQRYLLF